MDLMSRRNLLLLGTTLLAGLGPAARAGAVEAVLIPRSAADLADLPVDRILVVKRWRVLQLLKRGRVVREYKVALGRRPKGHKQQEGDKRTPEGLYHIAYRKPDSAYYRALAISYPNGQDMESARKRGVDPGGLIMIHGLPNGKGWLGASHRALDWTAGCIAVTNEEMDEIWALVEVGTPIEIRP